LLIDSGNKENTMPMVGKKKFPYSEKGEKEAKEYGKKKGVPVTIMVAVGKPKMGMPVRGSRDCYQHDKKVRSWKMKITKSQKKVGKVMGEFKEGTLHSGKGGKVVKNPKQAVAIALSEADMSKPKKKMKKM
jgi:hypothetical protein